jgi:phosphoglucomutase
MRDMVAVVDKIKQTKIESIGEVSVEAVRDYSVLKRTLKDRTVEDMEGDSVNAVYYELCNGGFVCVRPSGTEPKLKIYYSLKSQNEAKAQRLFRKVKKAFEELLK